MRARGSAHLFDLEALEQRIMLSGDSCAAVASSSTLEDPQVGVSVENVTDTSQLPTSNDFSQAAIGYDPADQVDDIFEGTATSEEGDSHETESPAAETISNPQAEVSSGLSGPEQTDLSGSVEGTSPDVIHPWTSQLVETLDAANGPPTEGGQSIHLTPGKALDGDGALVLGTGDILSGTGTVTGGLVNHGLFSPGNSPGVITIENSFTQGPEGTTLIEIGGTAGAGVNPNGHDQINIAGDLSLDGAIQLELFNAFVPTAGDSFLIFQWTGAFTDEGVNWLGTSNIPSNPDLAFAVDINEAGKTITLNVVSTHTIIPAAETALQSGLDKLQQLGDALDGIGELAEVLPLIGDNLGNIVDVGQTINQAIRNQLTTLLGLLPRQAEVTAEIESWDGTTFAGFNLQVNGVLGHYGSLATDPFWWEVDLEITQVQLNQILSDVTGAVLGAVFEPDPMVNIAGTLELDFAFGYDSGFFVEIDTLTARATIDAVGTGGFAFDFLNAPGSPISLNVTNWMVDFDAYVTATPDPSILDGQGRITLGKINQLLGISAPNINPADAFNLMEGGTVDASFTLDGTFGLMGAVNYMGTHTVRIESSDIFSGTDPDLTVVIDGSLELLDQSISGIFTFKKTATETLVEIQDGILDLSAGSVQILRLENGSGKFLLLDGDLAGSASMTIAAGPDLPNIDISGSTLTLQFNTSPGAVSTIDGDTVDLPAGEYFRVSGNAMITLAIPAVTLTGDFVFEPRDADANPGNGYEQLAVGVANLAMQFDSGPAGILQVTNGAGAFLFTEDGILGWASAMATMLAPGLGLSGTFSLFINDTDAGFGPLDLDVNGTTVSIPVLPAGPYVRVTGENAELEILGLTFSGDFTFEQQTTMDADEVVTVGFANVELPLGTLSSDLVDITNIEGAFIITDEGVAGTASADVSLDVPGVTVGGGFTLRINTTEAAVNETVDVVGTEEIIDVPVGPYVQVNGTGVTVTALGVTMTGNFSFEQRDTEDGTQLVTVVADSVNFDVGTDIVSLSNGEALLLITDSGMAGQGSIDVGISAFGETFEETFNWDFNNTSAPIDEVVDWEGDLKTIDLPDGPFNRFSTNGPVGFSIDVGGQPQAIQAALVLTVVDENMDLNPDYVTVGVSELETTLGGAGVNLDVAGGTGAFVLLEEGIAGKVAVDTVDLRVGLLAHDFLTLTATGLRVDFNNTNLDVGPITVAISDDAAEDVVVEFTGLHFRDYLAVAGTAELELDLIPNPAFTEPSLSGNFLFELSGSGASQVLHVSAQELEIDLSIGGAPILAFHEGTGAFVINDQGFAGVADLTFESGILGIMGDISLELNTTAAAVTETVTNPDETTTPINLTDTQFLKICVDNGHIGISSLSFDFSFTVEVDTSNGDLILETKTGDPILSIDGTTGMVSIDPLSGIDLSNAFDQVGPIEMVQMLRALTTWLELFADSSVFDLVIPFTEGVTLGDALDWAQVFVDHVFSFMVSVELQATQNLEQKIADDGSLTLTGDTFDLTIGEMDFNGISVSGTATALDNPGDPLDVNTLVGLFNLEFQSITVDSVNLGDLVEARVNRVDASNPIFAIALKQGQIAQGASLKMNNTGSELTSKLGFASNDGDAETADQNGTETQRYSVEEFVVELGNLLTGSPGVYDPSNKLYTFPVNIGWDTDQSDPDIDPYVLPIPFAFDQELGPIGNVNLEGELELTINAELGFTIGFDLNAAEVPRVISTTFVPAPSNGKLTASANFQLLLNENPDGLLPNWIPLTLTKGSTNTNSNLDHLAADFNDLFTTAMWNGTSLDQLLVAQKAGNGIAISVKDDQLGLINLLAARSLQNDPFATEIGFGVEAYADGGQNWFRTVSKSRIKGLFIEDAGFTGSIGVDTVDDITGSLELGFLSIDLEDPGNLIGTFDPYAAGYFDPDSKTDDPITLSVGLQDGESGSSRFYISELLNGLEVANIGNMVDGPNLEGSFYAGLTNISAGIGPVSLPTGAEISLWVPEITELDYNPDPYDALTNNEGIFLTYPDLGSFENFNDISFSKILEALNFLVDSLSELSAFSFLDEKLPLVDVSVNDLVDYAVKFAELIEEVGNGNATTIQGLVEDLEEQIEMLFGLDAQDAEVFSISLDDSDGDDMNLAAPLLTVEGGDGRSTVTYDPLGDNNGLIFHSTSTDNAFNGSTIRLRGTQDINDDSAMAEWDLDTKTLTIFINGGETTANEIIGALVGTPWEAELVGSDNPISGNTGNGVYSLSALKFSLTFTTGYANTLPFQLDLNDLVEQLAGQNSAAAGFLDAVTTFIQAEGSGVLTVSASAELKLDFGLDLTNPSEVKPFFYDTTGVELLAKVLGTDIEFSATIGAVAGIKVSEGMVTLDADGNPETDAGDGDRGANFRLGLRDNNGDGRHYFDENWFDFDNIDLHMEGGIKAELPIFIIVGSGQIPLGSDADNNGDGVPDNVLSIDIPDLVRLFVETKADQGVALLRVPGANNDLSITRTAGDSDDYQVVFQQNGGLGSGASASFSNNTLTVQINSDSTEASTVQTEIIGLGDFMVDLVDDDPSGPNSGNGKVTTSKLGLITPDISSLFADLDLCDTINQNAGLLLDGLDALLGNIQDGLAAVAYSVKLPLIGDGFAGAADFIGDFRSGLLADLRNAINSAGSVTAAIENAIKEAFWNLLGPGGLNILANAQTGEALDPEAGYQQLDVTLTCDDGLRVNLRLKKEIALVDTSGDPIDFDIGVPGFGLEVEGNVKLAVGFDLKLGFGFNKQDGFFFDSSAPSTDPELRVYISATIPGLTATGTLLFLELEVTDDPDAPSHFTGEFVVDLMDPNNDGKLTFAEMTSSGTQFSDLISANLQAEADINLDLVASFGGSASFPRVLASFHLDWMFDLENGAGTPQIAFTDVGLDVGSFISQFLAPVLEEIQKLTKPTQPIIDVVTARLPVLSDLAGEDITLLDLAELFGLLEPSTIDFIESVIEIVELINKLDGLGEGSIIIPFGAFSLGKDESGGMNKIQVLEEAIAMTGAELEAAVMEATAGPGTSETYQSQAAGFMGDVGSLDNFSIPLFDNPGEIFNIFIGEPVRLVEWRMPTFLFEFVYTQKIPIYPPLYAQFGGKIGAKFDFGIGYDTFGLQKFFGSEEKNVVDLFDGFYVIDFDANGNEQPEVTLYGELFAGASLDLLIVEAGVRGGVFAKIEFDLNDINDDGRIRPSEFVALAELDPRCIFNIHGEIGLFLEAFLIVDLFFFSIDKTWRFAEITLLEFDITCPEPVLATPSGSDLTLHIGDDADKRIEYDTSDGSEIFVVRHIEGAAGNETVEVQWGNWKKEFEGVGNIIINDAGEGDDLIDFRGVLATVTVNSLGPGNDTIYLGDGANSVVHGGTGNDLIVASGSPDATGVILYGDDGNDTLTGGSVSIEIYGGAGNDTITGSPDADDLYGEEGNDYITAFAGDDFVDGGSGNDEIFGDTGFDYLLGGAGNDYILGMRDDDIIEGGDGDDEILGGSGNDILIGGLGNDLANGHSGIDVLIGDNYGSVIIDGSAVDRSNIGALMPLIATQGVSVLEITGDGDTDPGNDGDDLLIGGGNIDILLGGEGDDFLYGGNLMNAGVTSIIEEDFNDFFDGGPGDDTIFGDDAVGRTGDRNTGIAIKSSIFFDSNENGRRDSDETGFGGVKVELFIVGIVTPLADTMTSSDGSFEFVGLDPASYILEFSTTLSGLSFTTQYAPETMGGPVATLADEDALDSDVDAGGATDAFLVDFNETESSVSAGFIGPAKVSVADESVLEGNGGQNALTFTVNLSHFQGTAVEVEYQTVNLGGSMGASTLNGDYESASGTLIFNPGETSQLVTVYVNGDTTYEEHQQFELLITRAQRMEDTPVDLQVTSTQILGTIINDDDIPMISIGDYDPPSTVLNDGTRVYLVGEGQDATFTISLSNPSQYTITVLYRSDAAYGPNAQPIENAATPDGLGLLQPDFDLVTDVLVTFLPGQTQQQITVEVFDETEKGLDPLDEEDENFFIDLYNPVRARLGDARGVGIIADDDGPVSVSIAPSGAPVGIFEVNVLEGTMGPVFVPLDITLSEASGKPVTVTYATAPGTAVEAVYSLDVFNSEDYTALPNSTTPDNEIELVFEPGDLTRTIMIEILPDNRPEGNEYFFVNLLSAANAEIARDAPLESNHVIININDDDIVPDADLGPWSIRFSDAMYMIQEPDAGTAEAIITLERNPGSSASVVVFYTLDGTATAGLDYDKVFRQLVVFGEGEGTVTVPITVYADAIAEGDETVKLFLRAPTGQPTTAYPNQATLVIKDDDVPSLNVNAPTEFTFVVGPPAKLWINKEGSSGGLTPWAFEVELLDKNGLPTTADYGVVFEYEFVSLTARNGQDFMGSSGIGVIPAGMTSVDISVDIVEDMVAELSETFALRIKNPVGASLDPGDSAAVATIYDDDLVEINGQVFYDSNGNGFKDATEKGIKNVTVTLTYLEDGVNESVTVMTDSNGVYVADVTLGPVSINVDGTTVLSPYQGILALLLGSGNYETTTDNENQSLTFDGIVGISPFDPVGYKNSRTFAKPQGSDDIGRGGTDDTIFGGPGNDTIDAGAGDDHVVGGHWMTATDGNLPVNTGNYDAVITAVTDPDNPDDLDPESPPLHNVYDNGPIFEVDTSALGPFGSISGEIWFDTNDNGNQNGGEPLFDIGTFGLPVVVNLYDGQGNWVNSLVSTDGTYTFSGLGLKEDGSESLYVVQFQLPDGFKFAQESQGLVLVTANNDGFLAGRTDKIEISLVNGVHPSNPDVTDIDVGLRPSDLMPAPGAASFEFADTSYNVNENDPSGVVTLTIVRNNSFDSRAVVVRTRSGTATEGVNFDEVNLLLNFEVGETFKTVDIPINDVDAITDFCTTLHFFVELRDPTGRPYGETTVFIYGDGAGTITDDDVIQGGDDWDIILGDSGVIPASAVIATPASLGSITFAGGPGQDIINGGNGPDWIDAQIGDDIIAGDGGRDIIFAGLGDDLIIVERSDDIFVGETVNGGFGYDTVVSERDVALTQLITTGPNTADLWHRDSEGDAVALYRLTDIEMAQLYGGYQNNTFDIQGWNGSAFVVGRQGSDTLLVNNNTDMLLRNATFVERLLFQLIHGFSKDSALSLPDGSTYHLSSLEDVVLTGGNSANKLDASGYSRRVTLIGLGGNDELIGGSNNDTFVFDADDVLGTDTVTGNGGRDTLYFGLFEVGTDIYETMANVTVDLADLDPISQTVVPGNLNLRLVDKIENATGGAGNDTLIGNDLDNVLIGGLGNDTLEGREGNETYVFDTDTPWGMETVIEDILDIGHDILDFSGTSTEQINLNMSILGSFQAINGNLELRLLGEGVEEVRGGALSDTLRGNSNNNTLRGNAGNDVLDGKSGDDKLDGGTGNDDLNGGPGTDLIEEVQNTDFTLTNTSLTRATGEVDVLDNIEVARLTGGSSANTFILTGWTGTGSVNGRSGFDSIFLAADANLALTNSLLTATPGLSMQLASVENAFLSGGPSANVIDTNGFTGNVLINAGDGNDTILAGAGSDFVFGGLGVDTYIRDLSALPSGANVTLQDAGLLVTWPVEVSPGVFITAGELDLFDSIEDVQLTGSPFNDTFDVSAWSAGSISLDGGLGTDIVTASVAGMVTLTDTDIQFTGGVGSIDIAMMEQAILTGSDGNDVLDARDFSGGVQLFGGPGDDILIGSQGLSIIAGQLGDDVIYIVEDGILNLHVLGGGEGVDTLSFAGNSDLGIAPFVGDVTVDLSSLLVVQNSVAGDVDLGLVFEDLEILIGGNGIDLLTGNSQNNIITGGPGADILDGFLGTNTIRETVDANFILTDVSLVINGEVDLLNNFQDAELTGGAGNNVIDASNFSGDTILSGLGGQDTLIGGMNNNTLVGGADNDLLRGNLNEDIYRFDVDELLGEDTIDDLGGDDILDFSFTESEAVTVDLSLVGILQVVHLTNLSLTLTNTTVIENIIGGQQSDTLTGNGANNGFWAWEGDDIIDGAGGDNFIFAVRDADYLLTGSEMTITTTEGSETDTFSNIQQTFITGGAGDNVIDASAFDGVLIANGAEGNDTVIGGRGDDIIAGGDGNDFLFGGAGNDTINGGDGDDILNGGADDALAPVGDDDILNGGNGNDTYVFDLALTSAYGTPLVLGTDTVNESPGGGYADTLLGIGSAGIAVDLLDTTAQEYFDEDLNLILTLLLVSSGTVEFSF